MLTGISAPTAWPFFQFVPPHLTVARTALGTVYDGFIGAGVIQLFGINLAVGDLLLVATGNDAVVPTGAITVDVNGNVLTQDVLQDSSTFLRGTMNHYAVPAAIVGGTITATASGGGSVNFGMLACKVSGLTGVFNQGRSGQFASTANPQTAATAVYPFQGFHWGFMLTNGNVGDTLGVWQNGYTAGQRTGGAAGLTIDLKEGFKIVNGLPARAQLFLQTARRTVAMVGNYGQ